MAILPSEGETNLFEIIVSIGFTMNARSANSMEKDPVTGGRTGSRSLLPSIKILFVVGNGIEF